LTFFYKSILGGFFPENWLLLILNGHDFHVTIWTLEQIVNVKLNMVTLPTHISHAFQPLDVTCFKPIKITFRKVKDFAMAKNNYLETYKVTPATCTSRNRPKCNHYICDYSVTTLQLFWCSSFHVNNI
jgi:hypothetical protein